MKKALFFLMLLLPLFGFSQLSELEKFSQKLKKIYDTTDNIYLEMKSMKVVGGTDTSFSSKYIYLEFGLK